MRHLTSLLLALLVLASQTSAQTAAVVKTLSTNALTGNLVVPSGNTFTIDSGATITINAGATANGLQRPLTAGTDYLAPSGNGSALTSLSASNISSGTLNAARLPDLSTTYQPVSTATTTELNYVHGVTSAIQTQLAAKQNALTAGTDYLAPSGNGSALTSLNASNISSGILNAARLPDLSTTYQPVSTATTTELNYVHGVTSAIQTQLAAKQNALTAGTDYLAPSGNGSALTSLNASNISSGILNAARLPDLSTTYQPASTATTTELNYVHGVTSTIQTQFAAKLGGSTGSTDRALLIANGTGGATAQASTALIDSSGALVLGGGSPAKLIASASDVLAQRNGTTAQAFRVYNTYTDASNGAWFETNWSSGTLYLRTIQNGTGGAASINFTSGSVMTISGSAYVQIGQATKLWFLDSNGTFYPGANNAWDIGTTTSMPRTLYLGTTLSFSTDAIITRAAAATVQLGVNAAGVTNQTLKACDRITTDGAGAYLALSGGLNRGANAGGSVKLQTSPATSANTTGTAVDRLVIDSDGVALLKECTTIPAGNPSAGFYLYVDPADHALKARGASGTVTTLAAP